MYISKLFLKEFGKFNNREIKLEQGLNILYGDKGSGKSTIRDFVMGMLFGLDRSKGLGTNGDTHSLRRPATGDGYSGKAHVIKNGAGHLLERDFRRNTDGAALTDIESGQAERLKSKNSYKGVLFDMDKSTYSDTLCIEPPSDKAADKDICEELAGYLLNMKETGSASINRAAAVEYLENEKKKYDNRKYLLQIEELEASMDELGDVDKSLEDIRQARREELDAYNMEIARLKREARQLVNEKDADIPDEDDDRERSRIFLEVEALNDEPDVTEKKEKKKWTDNIFVIMAMGIAVVVIVMLAVRLVGFQKSIQQLFTICTIAFVAITIIDGLFRKGTFDADRVPSDEEYRRTLYELGRATESRTVRIEIDRVFQEEHDNKLDMLKFQEHDAIEKRDAYYELKEKRDAIFVDYDALETERKAIDTAIAAITRLSDEFGELFASLESRLAELLGLLTGGVYSEVKLDETMHVLVKKDEHFFRAEYLGHELVRRVYLAVRLSVASIVDNERLPLVLDDVVDVDDRDGLMDALRAVGMVKTEQIILLTSNRDIADMIGEMNVPANIVEL